MCMQSDGFCDKAEIQQPSYYTVGDLPCMTGTENLERDLVVDRRESYCYTTRLEADTASG